MKVSPDGSPAGANKSATSLREDAPGRLNGRSPVAIIDIGSNSVRLVIYEGATRSPTPLFNEKVLAGLGKSIATTGRLDEQAMDRALAALRRFRAICDQVGASDIYPIATAAAREAENGKDFIRQCADVCRCKVQVLTGREEARLTAQGVISGFRHPEGIAADLGGGSLELIHVKGTKFEHAATLPLGGLRLADMSGSSRTKAMKLVREAIKGTKVATEGKGQTLYAIGGTFRALGNLHMAQRGYPLHVMHNYKLAAREALDFARFLRRVDVKALSGIDTVSSARQPLLVYGAIVLEQLVKIGEPRTVALSALGVREGLLFDLLDKTERKRDPLMTACEELCRLRSRSPQHAQELCRWTDDIFGIEALDESAEEKRLRHAACLLADIGWRAHPDYRGEQSLSIIAHAAFVGIDHSERAYLALSVYYRHVGLVDEHLSPRIRELASVRQLDRARLLGACLRVAYLISAAAPGIITQTHIDLTKQGLVLTLPASLAALEGERLLSRLKQLGRLLGREARIEIDKP